MALGAVVKAVLSYLLIGSPKINIYGAPVSTFFCTLAVVALNLHYIRKATGELGSAVVLFLKPFLSSVVAIGACGILYYILTSIIEKSYLLTLASILLATILYVVLSLKMKAIDVDDIHLLPKGDKIEKLLRKVKLL